MSERVNEIAGAPSRAMGLTPRWRHLALMGFASLVLAVTACGKGTEPNQDSYLEFTNNTATDMAQLYIAQCTDQTAGPNLLGGGSGNSLRVWGEAEVQERFRLL